MKQSDPRDPDDLVEPESPMVLPAEPSSTREQANASGDEPAAERTILLADDLPMDMGEGVSSDVKGAVVDSTGAGVPDVTVTLSPWMELGRAARLQAARGGRRADQSVTTDFAGHFEFEGRPTSEGGELWFGANRLKHGALEKDVDTTIAWQELKIPDPVGVQGSWTIRVVDQEGASVAVEVSDLTLTRGPSPAAAAAGPGPRRLMVDVGEQLPLVQPGLGTVLIEHLGAGTWTATLRSRESLGLSVESPAITLPTQEMPDAEPDVTSTVVLTVFRGANLESVDAGNDAEIEPLIHQGAPMAAWLPEDLLLVGEWGRDQHFARTFRFDVGGRLRGAELILDMEATSSASYNDSISLESLSGRQFAWRGKVDSITSKRWVHKARETVTLDLSNLTTTDGTNPRLLSLLEDGMLDVVIQDDTIVHSARLRVLR